MRKSIKRKIEDIKKKVIALTKKYHLFLPKRQYGEYTYTSITCCYNVEKYLDDYFRSMVNQRLDFKNNIFLIMVDDGSTDATATIIHKWVKQYPNNISYVYKVHGGLNSARGAGTPFVKTPWVTFIDADDFVEPLYFLRVDNLLRRHHVEAPVSSTVKLLVARTVLYEEASKKYLYNHPTRFNYPKNVNIRQLPDCMDVIIQSVAYAFFPRSAIIDATLTFPIGDHASWEDVYSVQKYLLAQNGGKVIFAKNIAYYYRKRAVKTSNADTATSKRSFYINQVQDLMLPLLKELPPPRQSLPIHLQFTVMYEMVWRLRGMFNRQRRAFLSPEDEAQYLAMCKEIFTHISSDVIRSFPASISQLPDTWRAAILGTFKNEHPQWYYVYLNKLDRARNQLCLYYYTSKDVKEEFYFDDSKSTPVYSKEVGQYLYDHLFFVKKVVWLELPKEGALHVRLNNSPAPLSFRDPAAFPRQSVDVTHIKRHFNEPKQPPPSEKLYAHAWLFMDRTTSAFDNATQMYRYVRDNHPEQEIYFALSSSAPDWNLLYAEGFNLVAHNTDKFHSVLRGCAKVIFSQLYPMAYGNILRNKHFIFLPHGALKDNISATLNSRYFDLFITTTTPEHEYIVADTSPFELSAKQVVLTGFPRHDALLKNPVVKEKMIMVMPTWRSYLSEKDLRTLKPGFQESAFALNWSAFLSSPMLDELLFETGFRLLFFPHFSIQGNLPVSSFSKHVTIANFEGSEIQDLFCKSSIFVTDYSSAAFEIAFLQKPIHYFQFDREEFLANHYRPGYFDYDEHGFGLVSFTVDELVDSLKNTINDGCRPVEKYLKRMQIFPHRDGQNCRRTYEAIKNLGDIKWSWDRY